MLVGDDTYAGGCDLTEWGKKIAGGASAMGNGTERGASVGREAVVRGWTARRVQMEYGVGWMDGRSDWRRRAFDTGASVG